MKNATKNTAALSTSSDAALHSAVLSSAVLYRTANTVYPCASKAQGMYITDATGKSYLDMSGGAAVSAYTTAHDQWLEMLRQFTLTLLTLDPDLDVSAFIAASGGSHS